MEGKSGKDPVCSVRVLYRGKFFLSRDNQLRYRKKIVRWLRNVDPDEISKVVIESELGEKFGLNNIMELWYLIPGKTIDEGLRKIDSDNDVMKMMEYCGDRNCLQLYVLSNDEVGPTELREERQAAEGSLEANALVVFTDILDREDYHGYGSESSSDGTDLALSGDEGDDEDDLWLDNSRQFQNRGEEAVGQGEEEVMGDSGEEEVGVGEEEPVGVGGEEVMGEGEGGGDATAISGGEAADVDNDEPDLSDEATKLSSELFLSEGEYDGENSKQRHWERFIPPKDFKEPIKLKSGMLFSSSAVFREALTRLTVQHGADYWYRHNGKSKITALCSKRCDCPMKYNRIMCICKSVKCSWQACGRLFSSDGTFQLKKIVPKHRCSRLRKISKVTSVWLADRYLEQYRANPSWNLKAFISAVRREYKVDISYWQARRARVRTMLRIHGEAKDQYARVWDYAVTLRECSLGTLTFVKVTDPERPIFQRLYVCLNACKMGFLRGCRDVIGVDGCHLRGLYTDQILSAVGQDGNNNIFPIAFAVVELETKETWTWLLDNLMEDVGSAVPTFISDRQKGLQEALNRHSSLSTNRICVRHLYENFKKQWPGEALKDAVWVAARALRRQDFDKAMDFIRKHDERAFEYLMTNSPKQWSRHAFDPSIKSDLLLNNLCKSCNAYILPAREMIVLAAAEWIMRALMRRFVAKRAFINKKQGNLTPYAVKVLADATTESTHCYEQWDGGNRFEVDYYSRRFLVDIENKSCTCFKWQMMGIPCCHAMHCITVDRVPIENYMDQYYTKERYLSAYADNIPCVPDADGYTVTGLVPPLPPTHTAQPGRPKKNARKRGEGEQLPGKVKKKFRIAGETKCSNCGQPGHNKKCYRNPTKPSEPKILKPRGRPANPNTVHLVPKRKYTKKVEKTQDAAGRQEPVDTSQGVSATQTAQGFATPQCSQTLSQNIRNKDVCSQTDSADIAVPRRSPRKKSDDTNGTKTAKVPSSVPRRSPRKNSKDTNGTKTAKVPSSVLRRSPRKKSTVNDPAKSF